MQSLDLHSNGFDVTTAPAEPPRTLDIAIDPPIVINDKTYDTLRLQEPTAFQVEDAEKEMASGMTVYTLRKYQIKLVANVSGIPAAIVQRIPISKVIEAFNFLPLYQQWPTNWRDLIADLAYFWHWGPREAWSLSGSELVWWLEQANRIVERENLRHER